MNWTQSICDSCWWVRYPGCSAAKLVNPQKERCCDCGKETQSGIYVRIDPRAVNFPAEEKE